MTPEIYNLAAYFCPYFKPCLQRVESMKQQAELYYIRHQQHDYFQELARSRALKSPRVWVVKLFESIWRIEDYLEINICASVFNWRTWARNEVSNKELSAGAPQSEAIPVALGKFSRAISLNR